MATEKKEREKQDLAAVIDDWERTIQQLTDELDTVKAEIAEMQVQLRLLARIVRSRTRNSSRQ